MFGLGLQELIILALVFFILCLPAVIVAVTLIVVSKGKGNR